jgi:hypothetical protein
VIKYLPPTPKGLHTNPDARAWADYFMACKEYNPAIANDPKTMVGWFANAMMAALDSRPSPDGLINAVEEWAAVKSHGSELEDAEEKLLKVLERMRGKK